MTRTVVVLSVLLSACQSRDGYFGRVNKPTSRRLVFENGQEPSTLDPHMMQTINEASLADCLFDSLVRIHPLTLELTADIATHYERNAEATRYVFYLRGNPHPKGIRLPNADDIAEEFRSGKIKEDLVRGHRAPPDSAPALWSDGKPVTAHDFVYSFRRMYDPKTASPLAPSLAYIENSAQILAGKRKPSELGVQALDDWTLEVLLAGPSDFFLKMLDWVTFFVVPRQAIEAAEARGEPASWVSPGHIVTSGPFRLVDWRPYEQVTVRKNPGYWEAGLTGLDEIVFLPITDNLTNINLYRSGHAGNILVVPPAYVPTVTKMSDHREVPALDIQYLLLNTHVPPLDSILVRYALNMATDKGQIAQLYNGHQRPAKTIGVPLLGYQPPQSLNVVIDGCNYDVTAYNPEAARQLLAKAGFPGGLQTNGQRLRIDFAYSDIYAVADELSEVLRRQWLDNLGIEMSATKVDSAQFFVATAAGKYKGVAMGDWTSSLDSATFLDMLIYGEVGGGTFWKPEAFLKKLDEAKATVDRTERLRKVAECDRIAMEGMPTIPLVYNVWHSMFKPYVKALPLNSMQEFRFKYAWVETQ